MNPLIIVHDGQTNRNVEGLRAFYDEMINIQPNSVNSMTSV
jgi:hypothetical protein